MNLSGNHLRILAALLSGFLVALGFPGESFPYLSAGFLLPVAYVPLFLAIEALPKAHSTGRQARSLGSFGSFERSLSPWKRFKSAFFLTWLSGAVTVSIAFFWCTYPAILFGGVPPLAAYPAFAVYALLSGTFFPFIFLPFLFQAAHEGRRNTLPLPIIALALVTTALEIWTPRFFHWSIGSLMHSSLSVSQFASVFGFSGITLFIIFSNASIARSITERSSQPLRALARLAGVVAMWFAITLWGNWRIHSIENELAQDAEVSNIGFVQPNFTFDELASNKGRSQTAQDQSLDHLLELTYGLAQSANPSLDLLIWPESVTPPQFAMSEAQLERAKDFAETSGTTLLAQATEFDREQVRTLGFRKATLYSTSFLVRPDRSRSPSYQKWIPMPFGEFVPFEDIFPAFGDFLRNNIGNMSKVGRGTSYEALPYSPRHYVAPLICFDAIDSELPRLQTKYGKANVFVNQSNFVWMGNSSAGFQFKELVRFRAIENGRSAVLAANTGPSVIFNPIGREITPTTLLLKPATQTAAVPIWRGQTLFTLWGTLPLDIGGVAGLLIIFASVSNLGRRRSRF